MSKKISSYLTAAVFALFIAVFGIILAAKPDVGYIKSEKRTAAKMPPVSQIGQSGYSEKLEKYIADRFPAREFFRRVRVASASCIFMQSEINGYRRAGKSVFPTVYPLNTQRVGGSARLFADISAKYFPESNIYHCVIPDKSLYLSDSMAIDPAELQRIFAEAFGETAVQIDITDALSGDSFYYTDIHWRQEALSGVLTALSEKMHFGLFGEDELTLTDGGEFYGSLAGQAAFPFVGKDRLLCYESAVFGACTVEKDGRAGSIYDTGAAEQSGDKYDIFLGGESALTVITNADADPDRSLVIFRDSFARSLAPLMLKSYSKIVLVDLRWMQSDMLGEYADVIPSDENTDVLFLLGTQVLNSMVYR